MNFQNPADKTPAINSPLSHDDWTFVNKSALDDFSREDWNLLARQRDQYQRENQARHVLRFLECSKDDASFGYTVNMYRHALQAATMVMRDGLDEETIVVTLLHDIGFIACPLSHGEFASQLLKPYVSDRHVWMLERHAIFQEYHIHECETVSDRHRRDRWRGHPDFEYTANWVARYDQNCQDAAYDAAPLETFEPMVYRLFSEAPREILPD